jgi:uncharacterized membrane protein
MSRTVGGFPSAELMLSTPTEVGPAVTSEAIRIGSIAGGGLLALYGLVRRGWLGWGAVLLGGAAIAGSRVIAQRPYTSRWHVARGHVTVLAHPQQLFDRLRLESFADLFSFVAGVEVGPEDHRTLLLRGSGGGHLRWHVQLVGADPTHGLSWRSTPDSQVPGDGEIRLIPAPGDRGTEIHARILLGPPAGMVAAIAGGLVGNAGEPGVSLQDDLNRLKQLVEAGEIATTVGQPRGRGRRRLKVVAAQELPAELHAQVAEEAP